MYPEDRINTAQMAGPAPYIRHSFPNEQSPQLDPKDERLIELALRIGYIEGRNSVLEVDNVELKHRNARLKSENELQSKALEKAQEDRDEYREKHYESDREVGRLKQYEPKEEDKINEGNNLSPRKS